MLRAFEVEDSNDRRRVVLDLRLEGYRATQRDGGAHAPRAGARGAVDRLATLASSNENKLRELRHALPGWELELLDADEYPPEDGETYYENARAKAEFGRTLEPDAWSWARTPGSRSRASVVGLGSSRRAGQGGEAERAVEELAASKARVARARYVCELVAIAPDGTEHRGTGILEGRIAEEPRGTGGFGFDPVFIPEGEERTVADLGEGWKLEHSHRARAARALVAVLS